MKSKIVNKFKSAFKIFIELFIQSLRWGKMYIFNV